MFYQFLSQLRTVYEGLTPARRVAFLMLVLVVIVGFIGLSVWAKRPEMQLLYGNMDPEDAGAVVVQLRSMNVPYEIVGDGRTIMVPREQVYDLRLQLAGQGLPQGGGVGFEIFDKRTFGMTEFVQKLNFQRALQGELARTINQLDEVEASRVHIVIPEKSVFIEDRAEPTASVVVRLAPGRNLSKPQVASITHLVASAVENMDASKVTLVDTKGQWLHGAEDESEAVALSNSQRDFQGNLERTMEQRIETLLQRVTGPGKAMVRVAATMDFQQVERTEESFDPDSQVVRSEQRNQEKAAGTGLVPGGVPGAASNLETEGAEGGALGNASEFSKQNETINYEINKVVRRVVEPVGTVERLSVAVVVDGSYQRGSGEGGTPTVEYIPRTPEEMEKFDSIVKNTIGFDEGRGDKVAVQNIAFGPAELVEEQERLLETQRRSLTLTLVRYGSVAAFLVFLFAFVLRPLLRMLQVKPEEVEIVAELPKTVEELEIELQLPYIPEEKEELPTVEYALQVAREDPYKTARLLRSWITGKGLPS